MLPETGSDEDFRDAAIAHLPIWELGDRLLAEGIMVHDFGYRPKWVYLEVSWHMAEEVWEHAMSASAIKAIIVARATEQGYEFSHWQLKAPDKALWMETIDSHAKQAKVFLKIPDEIDLTAAIAAGIAADIQKDMKRADPWMHPRGANGGRLIGAEVNANILASSFKMSDEAGLHDRD